MDSAKMLINYPELFSNEKLTVWDGYITIPVKYFNNRHIYAIYTIKETTYTTIDM